MRCQWHPPLLQRGFYILAHPTVRFILCAQWPMRVNVQNEPCISFRIMQKEAVISFLFVSHWRCTKSICTTVSYPIRVSCGVHILNDWFIPVYSNFVTKKTCLYDETSLKNEHMGSKVFSPGTSKIIQIKLRFQIATWQQSDKKVTGMPSFKL